MEHKWWFFFRTNVILPLENIKKNAKSKRQWWYWFNWTLIYSAFGSSKWNCYSEFCISYVPGEPCPLFNDRAFQNSNCSERRSFQIMRFWQIIGKWLGIANRDWCGWVNLMFSVIKLGISQKFHVQQPITSRMSSHSRAIWHLLKAMSFLKRWVYIFCQNDNLLFRSDVNKIPYLLLLLACFLHVLYIPRVWHISMKGVLVSF